MSEEDAASKQQEANTFIETFVEKLDLDQEAAEVLVQEGFTSVEEWLMYRWMKLLQLMVLMRKLQRASQQGERRAVNSAIASEEDLPSANIADDLLNMDGMDDNLALELAKKGIVCMEDLAEQSVDELMDIELMSEEKAGKLIRRSVLRFRNASTKDLFLRIKNGR